jgi:hypothetical protein
MSDQLTLIEAGSDDALLLPRAEMEKRYTGKTVARIETKRNYILDLLAVGLPIEIIAKRTHSNKRIVVALGALYAQQVASDSMRFAQALRAKASRFLFLADQKAGDAKFGELMVGVGIATQRAQELEAGASALTDFAETIDADAESEGLRKFREGLKTLNGDRHDACPTAK